MSVHTPPCGPQCRYRHMYEGSQQSLSDMAARQAQAVERLGRMRTGVAEALRRRMPRSVLDAEAALGRRLRDLDDEALIGQVDLLVQQASVPARAGLPRLVSALRRAGFPLEGLDEQHLSVASVSEAIERDTHRGHALENGLGGLFDSPGARAASGSDLADLFSAEAEAERGPERGPEQGPEGEQEHPPRASESEAAAPAAEAAVVSSSPSRRKAPPGAPDTPALRPEVASQPAQRKGRRQVRARATAPEQTPLPLQDAVAAPERSAAASGGSGQPEKPAEQTATAGAGQEAPSGETSRALLAAVCIPRPVFAADLIPVAGSMEAVQAWERTCRKDNLPVRIVPAKMRHAARGSLIFPVDEAKGMTVEFRRSVWGDVLAAKGASYRGARLYELAVLLHRVGEQIVSHRLGEHTATFRLAQPGGLTGVVVVFGSDLASGSAARSEVSDQLAGLVSERLAAVAALTTNGESGVHEALVDLVLQEAADRGWQPNMPVVAGRSWEYADSRGTSATLVLGG